MASVEPSSTSTNSMPGAAFLCQAREVFGGVSLNVEERDDDRQPDHLFDHRKSAATLDDHQVSGWATLGELQMITCDALSQCLLDVQLATPAWQYLLPTVGIMNQTRGRKPSPPSPGRRDGKQDHGSCRARRASSAIVWSVPAHPVYITGEIGINHNGDLANAIALIDQAVDAGCDAVKFQKRTPEICTPREQRDIERDTPWGRMSYIDYRHRVEFGVEEYAAIDAHAKRRGIAWFASPWDIESVDFLEAFDVPAHKVASACLTDDDLLRRLRATGRTIILSTGMSTMRQIRHAVEVLGSDNIILCHATSTYPAPTERAQPQDDLHLAGRIPQRARSDTPATRRACRRRLPRSLWARSSWSGTSPWTVRCGAPTRPLRSSRRGWAAGARRSGDQRGDGRRGEAGIRRRASRDEEAAPSAR